MVNVSFSSPTFGMKASLRHPAPIPPEQIVASTCHDSITISRGRGVPSDSGESEISNPPSPRPYNRLAEEMDYETASERSVSLRKSPSVVSDSEPFEFSSDSTPVSDSDSSYTGSIPKRAPKGSTVPRKREKDVTKLDAPAPKRRRKSKPPNIEIKRQLASSSVITTPFTANISNRSASPILTEENARRFSLSHSGNSTHISPAEAMALRALREIPTTDFPKKGSLILPREASNAAVTLGKLKRNLEKIGLPSKLEKIDDTVPAQWRYNNSAHSTTISD
jgi:hypothetical protein